jgi:hypothetical protein
MREDALAQALGDLLIEGRLGYAARAHRIVAPMIVKLRLAFIIMDTVLSSPVDVKR